MDPQEYKNGLITRLQIAGDAFYAVNDFYRSGKKDEEERKELLVRTLEAMPILGEAIAVLESVPPRTLADLVERNIVHCSIVYQTRVQGRFIGAPDETETRFSDGLKIYFLDYLRGELSVGNNDSILYSMSPYTFENLGRICFSARDLCEEIMSIDSRDL